MTKIKALLHETQTWRRRYRMLAESEPDYDKKTDWRLQAAACAIREQALRDALKALKAAP